MPSANMPLRPLAIAPILWRWQSLMFVYVLFMAAIAPALFHGDDALDLLMTFDGSSSADANALATVLLLKGSALVSLMSGLLITGLVAELLSKANSWTMPAVRPSIAIGHAGVMLLLAAAHGTWGTLRAGPTIGLAVAAMTPFWYAVGTSVNLVAVKPRVLGPAILLLLVALFRTSWYAAFVLAWLPAAVTISVSCTVALLLVQGSRAWGRIEIAMARAATERAPSLSLPFGAGKRAKASAAIELASRPNIAARRGLLNWINAALEASSLAGGRTWFVFMGASAAVLIAFNYFLGTSLAIIGISMGRTGLQLSGRVQTPLSRRDRAVVQFWCGVVESTFLFGVAALLYAVLLALPIPRPSAMSLSSLSGATALLIPLACIAFAPLMQWPRALGRVDPERPFSRLPEYFISAIAFMPAAELVPRMLVSRLGDTSMLLPMLAIVALGVVTHAGYWLIVRRSFARRDLV